MPFFVRIFGTLFIVALACQVQAVNLLTSATMLYLTKAQHSLKQGNIASAKAFLAQAKKAAPEDDRVKKVEMELKEVVTKKVTELKKAAEFHVRNKNLPKALELYRNILTYDPEDADSSQRVVEIRQNQLVIDQYRRTGISVPEGSGRSHDADLYSAVSLLVRARDSFTQGDFETSKKHLEEILKREPNFSEAIKLKAEVDQREEMLDTVSNVDSNLSQGRLANALENVNRLIEAYPAQASFYVHRARIHMRSFSYLQAQKDLREARILGIDFGQLRPYLVEVAAGMEDFAQAYALAQGNDVLSPCRTWDTLTAWYFRVHFWGWFLFVLCGGLAFWAFVFFWRQFDALIGRYSLSHFWDLAGCLYNCRENGAISQIERLNRISKRMPHPWWLYVTGLCLMEIGQTDRAQELLLRSAESPSLAPRAHFFLGLLRGEIEQKLADYDLEQSVILIMGETPEYWRPDFLQSLEAGIIQRFCDRMKDQRFFELAMESMQGVEAM